MDHSLVPGKVVIELVPTQSGGRPFSPYRGNMMRAQFNPKNVEGCGLTFPKFGMTRPDSVVIGRDNILRLTMPAKRAPLNERAAQAARKPRPTLRKKPEPDKVDPPKTDTSAGQFSPLATPPNSEVMRERDTVVAWTKSGVRMYVGKQLCALMENRYYGVKSITVQPGVDGDVVLEVLENHEHNRIGQQTRGKDFRQISLGTGKLSRIPAFQRFFGPTVAHEVVVFDEGKRIVVTMKAPFQSVRSPATANALGIHKSPDLGLRHMEKPRRQADMSQPESAPLNTEEVDPLVLLRTTVASLNLIVAGLKSQGEQVTLRIKDDGKLGFVYEG
jgi:hypothetical protein